MKGDTAPPAWMFYAGDWLSDMGVRMLSWAARGLYIELMCYCWRFGYIPSNGSAIAQLTGCHDLAVVEECISLFQAMDSDAGKLVHVGLIRERERQMSRSEERRESGKRGASKRWGAKSSAIAKPKAQRKGATKQPLAKNGFSSSVSTEDGSPSLTLRKGESEGDLATQEESAEVFRDLRRGIRSSSASSAGKRVEDNNIVRRVPSGS